MSFHAIPYPGDDYLFPLAEFLPSQGVPRNRGAASVQGAEQARAHYAADDYAKRHRLPDDKPKVVPVETHNRRKPLK